MTRFCMLALAIGWLGAVAAAGDQTPFDRALTDSPDAWLVRFQSPGAAPLNGSPYYEGTVPPGTVLPGTIPPGTTPYPAMVNPAQPVYPNAIQDPFSGGAIPPQGFSTYGINGPQPYRVGWQKKYDVFWIPGQDAQAPASGEIEILGVDLDTKYTMPSVPGSYWSIGPQFNYRSISGPAGTATTDLEESYFRFGLDLALQKQSMTGLTWEFGFTPSIGTDFSDSLSSSAFMWDGRIAAHWQLSPRATWTLGAMYWDRVDDIVIPYAGVVWLPSDLWELRLVFPDPRASVFLGTPWGVPTWLYVRGEYHVEAYETAPGLMAGQTRVQFEDWRVAGGFRWETGYVTSFAEAGYIFGRNVEYENFGQKYDIDSGFFGRIGIRY